MEGLISAVIVNWNGEKYLYKCIDSLLKQSYKNVEIIIIDNGSTDNSVKVIKENFGDKVIIIENENLGYAGGSNKGIKISKGEFVLIANPDVVFHKDYLEKSVDILRKDDLNAAVTGKLLKYDFENDKIINVIDSAGIALNHKRQGRDIGQNEVDLGQFDEDKRIFGVCGAAAVFKKSALEAVNINDEYFDNDFFAYKEDIDLSWRLNLYGYKCLYRHDALGYHGRGMNSSKGIINTIKNRRNQSEFLKGISFRNHYWMIIKNEVSYTYKKDKIKIYSDLLKYISFFLLFDVKCLKYIKQIKEKKEEMLTKRRVIMENIKISDKDIYNLFDL